MRAKMYLRSPVPRGLESKISDKMAFLRKLDEDAGKS